MSVAHQNRHVKQFLSDILDVDNCGALLRMFNGMNIDDDSLAQDSYMETKPGENFLLTEHTLRHYATANYESILADTGPFETWQDNGSLSAAQRANTTYKAMLKQYEQPELSCNDTLEHYIADKKASMSDEWY